MPSNPLVSQQYEMVSVDKLTLHPDNPRKGNLELIQESIEENGFYGTLAVQKSTGYVLAGNHRLTAARNLGIEEVPVVWLDVNDVEAKKILAVDNRASDQAEFDEEALLLLLEDIREEEGELTGTGFNDSDLDFLVRQTDKFGNQATSFLFSDSQQDTPPPPAPSSTPAASPSFSSTEVQPEYSKPATEENIAPEATAQPQTNNPSPFAEAAEKSQSEVYFQVSYSMTADQRKVVQNAINLAKVKMGDGNPVGNVVKSAEALVEVCRAFTEGYDE